MVTKPTKQNRAKKQGDQVDCFAGAMKMVKEGASLAKASGALNVVTTSLHRKITKKVAIGAKAGRKPLLSRDDEEGIIELILYRSKRGVCMTDGELRILVRDVALSKGLQVPALFPSTRWPARFVARHGDRLTRKTSQILDIKRYELATEDRIHRSMRTSRKQWRGYVLARSGIATKRDFVLKAENLLASFARNNEANVLRSNDRDNMSVVACANAAGDSIPPMFIFQGKRRQLDWISKREEQFLTRRPLDHNEATVASEGVSYRFDQLDGIKR